MRSLEPDSPTVINHVASASRTVFETTFNVAFAVSACAGFASPGAGSAGTSTTSGFERLQLVGTTPPVIHVCTALAAQAEKSAVTALWPIPGTVRSLPWGNCAMTEAAPAVGVRMSKPPLIARTGTLGSGPAPSGAPPAGLGQPRQKSAFPKPADQVPNGPRVPAGRAAIAACSSAGRWSGGVLGSHGNGPSWHTVAA